MTLQQRIRDAGQELEPGWDDRDIERVWQGLKRKRRRRAVATGVGVASLAAIAVWALLVAPGRDAVVAPAGPSPSLSPSPSQPSHRDEPVRLADGSTAVPFGGHEGSLAVVEDTPQRIVVALAKGGARFDVIPRPERVFLVRAGEVTVSVLGTAFSVERVADRVGVTVTRGTVQVDWGAGARRLATGQRRLAAGEDGLFPPLVVSPAAAEETAVVPAKEAGPVRHRRTLAKDDTAAPAPAPAVSTPAAETTDEATAPAAPDAAKLLASHRSGAWSASVPATSARRWRRSRSGGSCSASCTVRHRPPWRSRAPVPWRLTARWRRMPSRARWRRGRAPEISIGLARGEPSICASTRTERGQRTSPKP